LGKAKQTSDGFEAKTRPALSPEAKQAQLIGLAMDNVERRLRENKASAQEIIHFLKLGTVQAELDLERAKLENELVKAKTESLQSAAKMEETYTKALEAMRRYSGHGDEEDENI